jgi:hypothetical protein
MAVSALAAHARTRARLIGGPGWLRAGVLLGILVLAFVVSRGCQQSQVRVTKEQAIATVEREVSFEPTRRQVRFLRQGLDSRPVWIVSLSIPRDEPDSFSRLAVARVDANTGKLIDLKVQRRAAASDGSR